MSDIKVTGQIHIIIISAKKLVNKDLFDKSDPYVVISYGGQQKKSKALKNNSYPIWIMRLPLMFLRKKLEK